MDTNKSKKDRICRLYNNRCTSIISVCSLLVLFISIIHLPQLNNCQTTTTTSNTKCNQIHRNNHHQQRQRHHQLEAPTQPTTTMKTINRSAKLINLGPGDLSEQQTAINNKQVEPTAAALQQPQLPSVSEEFSLALGNGLTVVANHLNETNSTGYNLVQQQDDEQPQQRQQQANNSQQAAANDNSHGNLSSDMTSNQTNATAANPDQQQQQVVVNTTPTLMAIDSINSPPVVPQPPPTTTSSLINSNSQAPVTTTTSSSVVARQQHSVASGRRMEEHNRALPSGHSTFGDGHSSSVIQNNQQQSLAGNPYAISSSPTSVSIITPLMNPLQQQQLQQQQQSSSSSMIKPITVVGNPISEADYSSATVVSSIVDPTNAPPTAAAAAAMASQQQTFNSNFHHHHLPGRSEKRVDQSLMGPSNPAAAVAFPNVTPTLLAASVDQQQPANNSTTNQQHQQSAPSSAGPPADDRMSGPTLYYSDGHLSSATIAQQQQSNNNSNNSTSSANDHHHQQQQIAAAAAAARLLQTTTSQQQQQQQQQSNAAVLANSPRRPSLPPPVNQANAASGFRSPMSPSGPLVGQPAAASSAGQNNNQQMLQQQQQVVNSLQPPINSLQNLQVQGQSAPLLPNFYQTSAPYVNQLFAAAAAAAAAASSGSPQQQLTPQTSAGQRQAFNSIQQQQQQQAAAQTLMMTNVQQQQQMNNNNQGIGTATPASTSLATYQARRPLNITRVEHISAECSNDLIRAVIVFNGTFKGIIYSSGYVNDPTCLYVNGTGSTRYEFSIRLNQCGTLGRQELHQPTIPGEARRRDQVMWNTLSIQYNSIIEQEWDEHFRVSCEYGSDFWKTVSFSPFNVETNTGSPVVFTINPPQCQMDVLLGHGMGPKIAVDGPVTVGDPLTLLIHMKSEKAGYDILVKNCVAHNGGKQRMQLIDSNGCVVNERFISPFRGTYNDNDLRHVTLYAYLKAFRFTGSPVLYLECEIHMCQNACPPQMCYWRRLSKRSVDNSDFEYTDDRLAFNSSSSAANNENAAVSDSLSLFKALQVRHEPLEPERARRRAQQLEEVYEEDDEAQLVCYRHAEVLVFLLTTGSLLVLILTIALTCCWRIRKLTRASRQYEHNRLKQASSLSPSLLSISGGSSSASSVTSSGSDGGGVPSFYGGGQTANVCSQVSASGFPNRNNQKHATNGRRVFSKQQQLNHPLAPRNYIICNQ